MRRLKKLIICILMMMCFGTCIVGTTAYANETNTQKEKVIINGEEKTPVLTVIEDEKVPLANTVLDEVPSFVIPIEITAACAIVLAVVMYKRKEKRKRDLLLEQMTFDDM